MRFTLFILSTLIQLVCQHPAIAADQQLILVHYMPWYEARPDQGTWGWHWTMNHFDPNQSSDGKREIASHYQPLIGPYDSGNKDILEYHFLTMKLAGIDGVIVDWYGLSNMRDYPLLHRNTTRALETAERLRMKFVICYEDQTISHLVKENQIRSTDRITHATNEINWLCKYWFQSPAYVLDDGQPLLLSFGQSGLSDMEWQECLKHVSTPVSYYSQHHRRSVAVGGFDWPVPQEGIRHTELFLEESKTWKKCIPVAFPRFVDIYEEAKLHKSYGRINDHDGETFRTTLQSALSAQQKHIQIATWNDWGEGTNIEPSQEFGYRDLVVIQTLKRTHLDTDFPFRAEDLQLPLTLYQARTLASSPDKERKLEAIVNRILDGDSAGARQLLQQLKSE